jgi:transcriptional regulator with XRE-family HTH domain
MPKNSLDPIDKHVGNRVRMRRKMLDMSQTKLANAMRLAGRTMTLARKAPPTFWERKLRDTNRGGSRGPRKRSK